MGRHNEWRKIAKKLRRKRIRQEWALKRAQTEEQENNRLESSVSYMQYLLEREELERFQEEEEKRQAQENEKQWLKREKEAQENWGELQKQFEIINEEKLQEEQRLLQEWKKEQEKIVKEKKRLKRIQEENEERQQRIEQRIAEYIEEGGELPEELRVSMETNPNREPCPFFQKTGACRFKDTCSRNHIRPSASSVLLFPNFYTHFHLSVKENEYGSDQSLELDDRELYKHFREFYHDVLPEMEKYGRVVQFKACQNTELHLRGNVYVEYARTRDALKSYKVFQGRFYAGKQVNVEFCNVASWKAAICGLRYNNRCPKGKLCNFLHVFSNPENRFQKADRDLHKPAPQADEQILFEAADYSGRHWRWSESPDRKENETERYKHQTNPCWWKNVSKHLNNHRKRKIKRRSRSRSKSPSYHRKSKRKTRSYS